MPSDICLYPIQMYSLKTRRPIFKLVVVPVFRHKKNYLTSPSANRYMRLMKELSSKLGTKFTMHDLRRTLGNRLWRRGVPIETIAKLLRHEDCGVTFKAYIGVDACNMRDALNALNKTRPDAPIQATTAY
jgi:integrase